MDDRDEDLVPSLLNCLQLTHRPERTIRDADDPYAHVSVRKGLIPQVFEDARVVENTEGLVRQCLEIVVLDVVITLDAIDLARVCLMKGRYFGHESMRVLCGCLDVEEVATVENGARRARARQLPNLFEVRPDLARVVALPRLGRMLRSVHIRAEYES
jgi:hypothetical protein